MTPLEFIAKWKPVTLTERSAAQQHFLDLCEMLGQPKPATQDPDGAWYTFERGVHKTDGGKGWADVWMRKHFGWEYKGKHKDLKEAYAQLLQYREDLENPPLLVVCDLNRFEVHTNFTNTPTEIHAFDLDHLDEPKNLNVLRKLFTDPDALKPQQTTREVTERVAGRMAKLADAMRKRDIGAQEIAHFLMKLMFCMFAEDIELLDNKVFTKVLEISKDNPAKLTQKLAALFQAMADGGDFGADSILHFNGGLFADADVIDLKTTEIEVLIQANNCDWSNVEPSIFGTLFERMLDPSKRSQIGAHYTSKEDIKTLLEPVLMAPLRREWETVKSNCEAATPKTTSAASVGSQKRRGEGWVKKDKMLRAFMDRLEHVTVLDPACGSGNFLYVALNLLLDLEKQVFAYASQQAITLLPKVHPSQLAGIEINPYAQQLAQVVIWIGYLQWRHHNGIFSPRDPVLDPIDNIKRMDAILDLSVPNCPTEPAWPEAEFIVGNPPFLGGKKMRSELGDEYIDKLFVIWRERVRPEADLCCYWFEKARKQIEDGKCKRAGLLATQGIRGGANRNVLKRIKETGDIFWAQSDRDWILDGATVHVSMVGFDDRSEPSRWLDGKALKTINTSLNSLPDVSLAKKINPQTAFMGVTPSGPFIIPEEEALALLLEPNPDGRSNSAVLRPYINGADITGRYSNQWIIDLNPCASQADAALYEAPFKIVKSRVTAAREGYRTGGRHFWRFERARPEMRTALHTLPRFLARSMVGKHHMLLWLPPELLPANLVIVFARDDEYFFGIVQSRWHDCWARAQGTQLRERESGFRYTPTTCFETFPFPQPSEEQKAAIGAAAKELDTLRNNWLNPPEWTRQEVLEFPGSATGPWSRYVHNPDLHGLGTVRYPRTVPKDEESASKLKKRTLTNLYNDRPTWLDLAHKKLDAAVFAAYGWQVGMTDEEILAKLLELNLQRAGS